MEGSNIHRARNILFIHLYGFGSLLHLTLTIALPISTALMAPIFGLVTYIIVLVLYYLRVDSWRIKFLILFLMNIYVFILNWEALSSVTIVYFVIPIIAAALYNDTRPIVILSLLSIVEINLLVFGLDIFSRKASLQYDHMVLSLFISIAVLFMLFHSIYFSRRWSQLEMKNKMMERALLSRDGYLHLFFETAKDAIAVFDLNDHIIAINPAFEKLYGWTLEECVGDRIPIVPHERLGEAAIRTKKVRQGESFSLLETVDMKKDGTLFPVQITLSPIFDHSGVVVATSVISRDITFQKESENLIVQSEKLKLAGEIAAGVAHEIRNPLTVISGFVQMMNTAPGYPYKKYTKLIQSEIERINLIISEFLVLAKPQASLPKKFSLRNTWNDLAALFGPEFNMRGILFTQYWEEEDFVIEGEEHQLKQVFINVLKNAIDAINSTDSKGKICLGVESMGNEFVSITLNDNGSGIPPEVLLKIFEPFYTTKSTGTGLGLIISQKIVQGHGGQLIITSEENHGTEAKIILPKI
ncbi:ATP-binding protein [Planococcus shixiaomingii]|uniref:ATP-binding protein n=1 Tax=Planococcus shixiaomingii TaxID=3058393 RepID=UPI00260E5FC9|nr:ATP-binding protein [Planococcus sp. N022]WKA53693.1 ATP-binding protein [Planococcus sp. N022]